MAHTQSSLALDVKAELGEGLHWDLERRCLWMVDIHGKRIIRWDLSSSRWDEWATPQRVGWVMPEKNRDSVIAGLQEGFARVWLGDSVRIEWLAHPFGGNATVRLNDAKADEFGAIWAGSMNNDDMSRSDGCLFRLSPDGIVTVQDEGYRVANGPAIRPDGKLLLHTDSARREIYAFDLDAATGRVAHKRIWIRFGDDEGFPDGMCFDTQGCVWVAHWGAGCVTRRSPDGRVIRRACLPAPLISNVCFAGPRLERLFVSSARTGMTAREQDRFPLAGSLFEVTEPGATGAPVHPCNIV